MRRDYLLYLAVVLAVMAGLVTGPRAGMAAYGSYIADITAGDLNQPSRVAIPVGDTNDILYVVDSGNKKVKKYVEGSYTFSFDVAGTPVGIAANQTNIFVGDDTNNCVWVYDTAGNLTDLASTAGTHKLGGASSSTVNMPNSIAIGPSGHIFVTDGDNDKILIFNATGSYNSSFGQSGSTASSGTTIYTYFPSGITMAESTGVGSGTVTQYFWFGDQGNDRVQKLYYRYNEGSLGMTTAPTFSLSKGSRGDAFGQFLKVSDLAYQAAYSRLIVVDSLQMVAQVFDASGNLVVPNVALNYTGPPSADAYLNVPTGIAIPNDGLGLGVGYVVSNQADKLSLFDLSTGSPPAITAIDPTGNITPTTTPYTINYTINDSDSASVDINVYYYEVGTPSVKTLIGSDTVAMSGGTGSSSMNWDWTSLPAGDYVVYGVAMDDTGNIGTLASTGNLSVVSGYDGCTNYTNGMFALYSSASYDYDGDGLSNCDELNGTNHTDAGNTYTSDMDKYDTDSDGLSDGEEDNAIALYSIPCYLNPRDPDTDGGGIGDFVEIQNLKDPCNAADDMDPLPQTIGAPINVGTFYYDSYVEVRNTDEVSPVYGNLVIRRAADGSIVTTIPVTIPASGTSVVRVQDYTDENNISADFVSYSTLKVVGVITCYILDGPGGPPVADYSEVMGAAGVAKLESGAWNDNKWRYNTWMCLRNPDFNSSVDITVAYYDANGNPVKSTPYTIAAASSIIIEPCADEGLTGGQYNCIITGDTGNVSGHFVIVRWNKDIPTLADVAIAMSLEATVSDTVIWDTFNDAKWRYQGFIGVKNTTNSLVTVDVTYYKKDGSVAIPTVQKDIAAHQCYAWRPSVLDTLPGGQYSVKVQSTGGEMLGGYGQFFRDNAVSATTSDLMIGFTFSRAPFGSTLYVPYWKDEGDSLGQKATFFTVRNASASPIDITCTYYDKDGNVDASVTTSTPVAAEGFATFRPTVDGCSGTEGSAKITATGSITGWYLRVPYNWTTAGMNDSGSGVLMQQAP